MGHAVLDKVPLNFDTPDTLGCVKQAGNKFFSDRNGFYFVSVESEFFLRFPFPDMEVNMSQTRPLEIFVQYLNKVPDPRSKQGQSHPFSTIISIVLLGLLANLSTMAAGSMFGRTLGETPLFPT